MTINEHIINLLYSYDCVIIPGFGGFVARYFPAEIQEGTYMFRPPSKRISFNARLKENDGLVAHYISQKEGISYQEALQMLEITVRSWNRILESGNKIILEGIGKIYTDSEGNLQFTPALEANFLTSSYGLAMFRSPAITSESLIAQSIRRQAEAEGKVMESPNAGYFLSNVFHTVKVASVVVVVGSIFYLAIENTQMFKRSKTDSFSYIGFTVTDSVASTSEDLKEEFKVSEPESTKTTETAQPTEKRTLEEKNEYISSAETPSLKEVKSAENPDLSMTSSAVEVTEVREIVKISVGAFSVEANAQNRLKELAAHNINGAIEPSGKLYRVVVACEKKEADVMLQMIKKTVAQDAFVLK
ncbi:cell division protein [Thermaurantimonas aggregans]|uniref:Cell division protein n=1 Tax=Thermaurantimonas aggregans TaxID=2173829 RepID=A0A401XJA6_9FLAO|nr:SPOR domain-containing protein [Thermaurantimonas aggregans]GCD77115.1 cell division protein [Thermaurantimonas aggregans]